MAASIARKVLRLLVFLLGLTFLSFCLLKLVPGDPVRGILRVDEMAATQDQMGGIRKELGLDLPLYRQYGIWLSQLLKLDLGSSYLSGRPVAAEFAEKLPNTLALAAGSLLVMLLVSLPLGALAARHRNRWPDRMSRYMSAAVSSMPSFWLGLLLIDLFAVRLQLLPPMGSEGIASLILPSTTLGLSMAALYVGLIRSSLIESGSQEFILSARARGIHPFRIFVRHQLRHSLVPLLTLLGESLASLLGGTVVIETLFNYPGIGKWIVDAVSARDYPVIMGYVLFAALFILLVNRSTEAACRLANPELARKELRHS
ncbi:nickel transporter permease NikB [Paenibacillus sp. D9]|uniref:nickel ABC transporter permease n=1 Tax=Paenibacillus sp. D9 TaxID=665792 RepID=UPI00061FFFF9|nr:nickel ABC transporter permease [Paenibacillus sp. D9]KKC47695.1 nickel transporter permease NikB [Paenibacillus sp. D9]